MCGIFGKLYFRNKKSETNLLLSCLNTLTHRGPDDVGTYEDDAVFLGSRRLSIIDLSPAGRMPMTNEDNSLQIVFNGEIFNYADLRRKLEKHHRFISRTDTEVILHLFEEKGPACLSELQGMFALAIWDSRKKELFLARDHLGKKPLKYYYDGNVFVFASELKAILHDPSIPREPDPEAISSFLTFQYIRSPGTGFKHIRKLEPAHYLIIRAGKIEKHKYWEPSYLPKLELSEEEAADLVLQELKQSVRLRLRSDVPLGAHLSGGIDSSLIVALMSRELNRPVKTFSVGFREKGYNELPAARLVADQYKTDHHEAVAGSELLDDIDKLAYHYEEPYADPSLLPTWLLCRETKKAVTVALNGDGGDESFAGYQKYLHDKLLYPLKKLPGTRPFLELIKRTTGHLNDPPMPETVSALGRTDLLLLSDLQSYLPDDLMVKTDIAGMAHALEVRSPFLDHRLVETVARLPERYKLKGWTGKYLLRKIAADYLPEETVMRKKQGFAVPLEHWVREVPFQRQLDRLKQSHPLFSPYRKAANGLLVKAAQERLGKDEALRLWNLLFLHTWMEVWFSS